MKYLSRLVFLCAVSAVAVPLASATEFSGFVDLDNAPAVGSYSGGTPGAGPTNLNGDFSLTSVSGRTSIVGISTLSNFETTPTLYTFTNLLASLGNPLEMYSATDALGDTVAFYATGVATNLVQNASGDITVVLTGYFTETSGSGAGNCASTSSCFTQTGGEDSLTFNDIPASPNGNLTEDFITEPAPEPNSFLLLGTGLFSAAGLLIRRRRTVYPQPCGHGLRNGRGERLG